MFLNSITVVVVNATVVPGDHLWTYDYYTNNILSYARVCRFSWIFPTTRYSVFAIIIFSDSSTRIRPIGARRVWVLDELVGADPWPSLSRRTSKRSFYEEKTRRHRRVYATRSPGTARAGFGPSDVTQDATVHHNILDLLSCHRFNKQN